MVFGSGLEVAPSTGMVNITITINTPISMVIMAIDSKIFLQVRTMLNIFFFFFLGFHSSAIYKGLKLIASSSPLSPLPCGHHVPPSHHTITILFINGIITKRKYQETTLFVSLVSLWRKYKHKLCNPCFNMISY